MHPAAGRLKPNTPGNQKGALTMKRTLTVLTAVVILALGASLGNSGALSERAIPLGCPSGCESQINLVTGVPDCTGIMCISGSPVQSPFVCDASGNVTFNCLCAGTYYFCLECNGKVYTATVSGSPSSSFATETNIRCPCN